MKICTVSIYLSYKVTLYIFRLNAFQCIHVMNDHLERKDHEYGKETGTSNFELRYVRIIVSIPQLRTYMHVGKSNIILFSKHYDIFQLLQLKFLATQFIFTTLLSFVCLVFNIILRI